MGQSCAFAKFDDVVCSFHSLFTLSLFVFKSVWNCNSSLTDMYCELYFFLFHVCCHYWFCLFVCLSVCFVFVCLWAVLPDFK